jgi:DNA-directed RNA polymerase specialized sigma24 family protein
MPCKGDLDQKFEIIMKRKDPEVVTLWSSIDGMLRQFNVRETKECIMVEVYLRAHKLLNKGVEIENLLPWCRKTALNCIREMSRSQCKIKPMATDEIEQHYAEHNAQPDCQRFSDRHLSSDSADSVESDYWMLSEAIITDETEALFNALARLTRSEKEILHLIIVEKLSYQEACTLLEARTNRTHKVTNLRKQKERILKHLRKLYHEEVNNQKKTTTDRAA